MPSNRPTTPTDLRKRLGDPGKGATQKRPAMPPGTSAVPGLTTKPPLDLTPEALDLWNTVTTTAKWLVESDAPALVLLCRLHDRIFFALKQPELSPAAAGAVKTYTVLLDKFGLTPAARINLGLAVAETQSRLDAFRKGAS